MDADIVAAIACAIIAVVMLAWGFISWTRADYDRIMGEDSNTLEVTADDRDFMSEEARRYHESNALGRN